MAIANNDTIVRAANVRGNKWQKWPWECKGNRRKSVVDSGNI
jgi:hypothetical protein